MTTRSKDGIFKPKALTAKITKLAKLPSATKVDYTLTKPPSYKVATQYPQWCIAMDEEFDALKGQGTRDKGLGLQFLPLHLKM